MGSTRPSRWQPFERGSCYLTLINNVGSVNYYTTLSGCRLYSIGWWTMNWKGFGREQLWPNPGTIPSFTWSNWGKSSRILNQDSQCHGLDSNRTAEYKCRRTAMPTGSVLQCNETWNVICYRVSLTQIYIITLRERDLVTRIHKAKRVIILSGI
jgi:hypothetical protein